VTSVIDDLTTAELPGPHLHAFLAGLRAQLGLAQAPLLGQQVGIVTRWHDLKAFLADEDAFPGGTSYRVNIEPAVGRTFISMDGEEHLRVRRLAMPAFQSKAVQRFTQEDLVPLVHEVLDRFAARGEGDLVDDLTNVLPFWAISRKLGLPRGSEERQRAVARSLLGHLTAPALAQRAAHTVADVVAPLLQERRVDPQPDVLSHLLTTGLTDDEVVAHVRLLYAVGATTTSDAMSNLFALVLSDPALLDRVVHEPECRPRVVAEVLRLEPPVAMAPRIAAHGGHIGGENVAPGTLLMFSPAAANRDPAVFTRPDSLDPDRTETEVMSFGFGPKFCPGWNLARSQLLAALEAVVERLPGLALTAPVQPQGAVLRATPQLPVRWTV
jgi:cytochrome P450